MVNRPKPPRSIFKHYDDAQHWSISIPVPFSKPLELKWDAANDAVIVGSFRKHLFFTYKRSPLPVLGGVEIRLRFGFQYL